MSPSFRMSPTKRGGFAIDQDRPGPGAYDDRDYDPKQGNGLAYTIPKAVDSPPRNNSPGPGHYYIPCTVSDVPKHSGPGPEEKWRWV